MPESEEAVKVPPGSEGKVRGMWRSKRCGSIVCSTVDLFNAKLRPVWAHWGKGPLGDGCGSLLSKG